MNLLNILRTLNLKIMTTIKINTEPRRKFKGKIDNFTNKAERNFEKKHLKAYLKGDMYFFYGKDEFGNAVRYEVQQELVEPEILK